jgi:membrane associated rhomboid family serine protease
VILLPIGHDDSAVRRQPWVTYTLMATCLVALLATNGRVEDAQARATEAEQRLVAAVQAWAETPYLHLDPQVRRKLPASAVEQLEALRERFAAAPHEIERFEVAAKQAEFDAGVREALADLEAAERDHPYLAHGLRPGAITAWGLLAHMFMHAGWLHLLGNLFMLFMAGPALEDRWGRPLFAVAYGLSGIGGALLFAALSSDPNIPLVGASGAIAGVFGAFLVRFWSTQIRFWYLLWFGFRVFTGTFSRPAYMMLPLWLANEVLQAWLSSALDIRGGVANTAHIGGFLVGGGAALAARALQLDVRFDRAIEAKTTALGNLAVVEALALRDQGDLTGAIRKLALQVKQQPRDAEAIDAYWDACAAAGCAGDAAHAVLALAQRELAANDGVRAAQRYLEVRAALPSYGFDVAFVARLVPHLREHDRELALQALRWLAEPSTDALAPTLAQRAFDQARDLDPLVAKQLARKLAATDLPNEMRKRFAAHAGAAPDLPAGATSGPGPNESAGASRSGVREPAVTVAEPTPDWDHTALAFEGDAAAPSAGAALGPELTEPEPELGGEAGAVAAAAQIASPSDDWDALALLESEDVPAPSGPRFASLKLTEATPLSLGDGGLRMGLEGGRKALLALDKIDAVALAAVRGLGPKPVLVVDLLSGWRSLDGGELRGVRLRSDRFDPRKLCAAPDPLAALRTFVAQLVAASGAAALHAADPTRTGALTPLADAATYEREVLEVGN